MLPSKRNLFKGAIVGLTALSLSVNTANAERTESVEIAAGHVRHMSHSLIGGVVEYYPLRSLDELQGMRTDRVAVNVEEATYHGYQAIKVEVQDTHQSIQNPLDPDLRAQEVAEGACDGCTFLNIGTKPFHNGVIEVDVASDPRNTIGFVGVFFRVQMNERQPKKSKYEGFYLRPENSLADEPFRNFATQYFAKPGHPWYELREQEPGEYEAYADLQPGAWTKLRIEVFGEHAKFYVNNNPEPVLVVDELKHGADSMGTIALYTEPNIDAYFKNLKITHAPHHDSM
ncbi:MAG: family 16 glycoside hydrolase [Cyanobacteria bacterium P01_E01_bin.42]